MIRKTALMTGISMFAVILMALHVQAQSRWPARNNAPAQQAVNQSNFGSSSTQVAGRVVSQVEGAAVGCQQCGGGQCTGSCQGSGRPTKFYRGVDAFSCRPDGQEPTWKNERLIPWEAFAFGEYVGPHRTPHLPVNRARVNDQIEFVYQITREQTFEPYRLMVGDRIQITSTADNELNQGGEIGILILSDGSISLNMIGRVMAARKTIQELQEELNEKYSELFADGVDPKIVVSGVSTDTLVQDLIDAVDARFGSGGQSRLTTVSPDGTIQLPMIGSVPAIGLTLEEIGREVNARYREQLKGIEVTPVLIQLAPRFIYVLGEVAQPQRVELTGPTSAMQAIALAGGWNSGGNLRQIVVFRRDHNWRLMALRLDLAEVCTVNNRCHPTKFGFENQISF